MLGEPAPAGRRTARGAAAARAMARSRSAPPGATGCSARAHSSPSRIPHAAGTPRAAKSAALASSSSSGRVAATSTGVAVAAAPWTMPSRTFVPRLRRPAVGVGGLVVEDEHLVDRRVGADRRDHLAQRSPCRPRRARCSRAGWRRVAAAGQQLAQPRDRRRRERAAARRRDGRPRRRRRRSPPPEHVTSATPRPAARRPLASALASSSSSWPSRAHAAPASSTSARKTRWSPAIAPVWVAAAVAPTVDAPGLEHRHADAALDAAGERLAQARRVAVVLDVQRDRAHALVLGEEREQVAGVEHGLVAARDDRVQAQPAAGGERVDREVAALADERDAARLLRAQRVAPQRRALVQADHAVAVRPDHRQRVADRGRHEPVLERRSPAVGEARAEHDRAAAAARARLVDHVGHAGGRDRDDDGVGRRGQVGERREHRRARAPRGASGARPRPRRRSRARRGCAASRARTSPARGVAPTTAIDRGRMRRARSIAGAI